ncbi:hypothetical protein B0H10DRAFT_2182920 [Mycena sp. CBHHK59/15]|nr:hypothetical protein B0H10DRAFT_2182920 [Mycena sp. CBHHK59/15]
MATGVEVWISILSRGNYGLDRISGQVEGTSAEYSNGLPISELFIFDRREAGGRRHRRHEQASRPGNHALEEDCKDKTQSETSSTLWHLQNTNFRSGPVENWREVQKNYPAVRGASRSGKILCLARHVHSFVCNASGNIDEQKTSLRGYQGSGEIIDESKKVGKSKETFQVGQLDLTSSFTLCQADSLTNPMNIGVHVLFECPLLLTHTIPWKQQKTLHTMRKWITVLLQFYVLSSRLSWNVTYLSERLHLTARRSRRFCMFRIGFWYGRVSMLPTILVLGKPLKHHTRSLMPTPAIFRALDSKPWKHMSPTHSLKEPDMHHILSVCTGIHDLACFLRYPFPTLLPHIESMRLCRLTINVHFLLSDESPIMLVHIMFAGITHLYVLDKLPPNNPHLADLALLPVLTHLACEILFEGDILQMALTRCKRLQALVVVCHPTEMRKHARMLGALLDDS